MSIEFGLDLQACEDLIEKVMCVFLLIHLRLRRLVPACHVDPCQDPGSVKGTGNRAGELCTFSLNVFFVQHRGILTKLSRQLPTPSSLTHTVATHSLLTHDLHC